MPSNDPIGSRLAGWQASFPDLAGKTAVVGVADDAALAAVVAALTASSVLVAVVTPTRETAEAMTALIDGSGMGGYAQTGDASDPALWERVLPHVEQRLGPVDIAVALGASALPPLARAVAADMQSRGRGVVIAAVDGRDAAGSMAAPVPVPRYRRIRGGSPTDVATAVLTGASDTLGAPQVDITITG